MGGAETVDKVSDEGTQMKENTARKHYHKLETYRKRKMPHEDANAN